MTPTSDNEICPISLAPLPPMYLTIKNEEGVHYSPALVDFLAHFSSTSPHTRKKISICDIQLHNLEVRPVSVVRAIVRCLRERDTQHLAKIYRASGFPANATMRLSIDECLSEEDKSACERKLGIRPPFNPFVNISVLGLAALRADIDLMHFLIGSIRCNPNFKWQRHMLPEGLPWLYGTENYTDLDGNVEPQIMSRHNTSLDVTGLLHEDGLASALHFALLGMQINPTARKLNAVQWLLDYGAVSVVEDINTVLYLTDNTETVYETLTAVADKLQWPSHHKQQSTGTPFDVVMHYVAFMDIHRRACEREEFVGMATCILDLPCLSGAGIDKITQKGRFFFDSATEIFFSRRWEPVVQRLLDAGAEVTSKFIHRAIGELPENNAVLIQSVDTWLYGLRPPPYAVEIVMLLIERASDAVIMCDPTLMTRALVHKQPVKVVQALIRRKAPMFDGVMVGRQPLLFWATADVRKLLETESVVMVEV